MSMQVKAQSSWIFKTILKQRDTLQQVQDWNYTQEKFDMKKCTCIWKLTTMWLFGEKSCNTISLDLGHCLRYGWRAIIDWQLKFGYKILGWLLTRSAVSAASRKQSTTCYLNTTVQAYFRMKFSVGCRWHILRNNGRNNWFGLEKLAKVKGGWVNCCDVRRQKLSTRFEDIGMWFALKEWYITII